MYVGGCYSHGICLSFLAIIHHLKLIQLVGLHLKNKEHSILQIRVFSFQVVEMSDELNVSFLQVQEFVNGYTLLREMGFSSNSVAEALLMYDNDTDKALAHFLSSS